MTSSLQAEECSSPSIDRLQIWETNREGPVIPFSGSTLIREGNQYISHVEFTGEQVWHVMVVQVDNQFEGAVDWTSARYIEIKYSATEDFWVQLRPSFAWNGGAQWIHQIKNTDGQEQSVRIQLQEDAWTTLEALGSPSHDFRSALAEVRGLVFVGNAPNIIKMSKLRIDGYQPTCR
ncbi:MAG: hypothetical protein MK135_16670 [Polyangiaceae bacterium]|nr:hypothetical protein [Polyangiaceae bacterium]